MLPNIRSLNQGAKVAWLEGHTRGRAKTNIDQQLHFLCYRAHVNIH